MSAHSPANRRALRSAAIWSLALALGGSGLFSQLRYQRGRFSRPALPKPLPTHNHFVPIT